MPDPWTLANARKKIDELIRDTQDGITQERKKLAWMAPTASHRDLATQVRSIAALEARLSTLREVDPLLR